MCGLSLAWVTSENSTMLLESDSSWLLSLDPIPCCLVFLLWCLVLTAPPWIHANLSVRLSLSSRQLPSVGSRRQLLSRVPFPLPDTARFHVQESFVWFRAKKGSSALTAYPHSATLCSKISKHGDDNIYALPWGLSTLAKELSAAPSVMQKLFVRIEHSGSR